MKTMSWKKLLLGAMVASQLFGCNPMSREEVLASGGSMPTPPAAKEEALGAAQQVTERYKGGEWECTTQKYQASEAPQDFVTFEPNPAVIWPGSLVQGASLESGAPEPVAVKRGPGTVLLNLVNASTGATVKSYQVKLDEVNQGNVIDAQNEVLSNNAGATPAAFTFESTRIDSEEELALAMNARAEWLTGDVAASMKFNSENRFTRYLVKLTQRYYTMVYQTPSSVDELIDPSVSSQQLAQFVGPGNPATYISSVTYGRQFYLLFESTASSQELEAALRLAYNGLVASASFEAQASYRKVQSQTTVKAFAVGGGAEAALSGVLAASSADFDKLHEFIIKGSEFGANNPGLPISYTVRNANDHKLVKVGVATEFVRKSCIPLMKNDEFVALWLDAQTLPPVPADTLVTTWPGQTQAPNDGRGAGAFYDPAGIGGKPALRFGQLGSQWTHFMVDLGGGSVIGNEYTVISVTKTARSPYAGNFFLQGSGMTENTNLHLGWEGNDQTLVHGHYNNDLRAQARSQANGDVLAFRFSSEEGKAMYQNGVLRGANAQKVRLTSNLDTRIGGGGIWPFFGHVGEVRVYSFAMTDAQRKVVECELGKKWDLSVAGCIDGRPDPATAQF